MQSALQAGAPRAGFANPAALPAVRPSQHQVRFEALVQCQLEGIDQVLDVLARLNRPQEQEIRPLIQTEAGADPLDRAWILARLGKTADECGRPNEEGRCSRSVR